MKLDYLYQEYKKDVYYFLYHLSQNSDIAEDLTSEVFLTAIKSLATFKENSSIKTWLLGIAKNKWFEFLRQKKKFLDLEERLTLYINEVDLSDEENFYNKELNKKVLLLLEKEPQKSKEIVLMRVEGFSFLEIAEKFDISESSARVIDFRTKKKIKQILLKEGFSYE